MPCLCGDTECPSCGTAQGTRTGRQIRPFTPEEIERFAGMSTERDRDITIERWVATVRAAWQERDARRESLAQEIREGLRARGSWAPDIAADLIAATFQAIDAARQQHADAVAEIARLKERDGWATRFHLPDGTVVMREDGVLAVCDWVVRVPIGGSRSRYLADSDGGRTFPDADRAFAALDAARKGVSDE